MASRLAIDVPPEDLTQIASQSEEGFKQFITETERLESTFRPPDGSGEGAERARYA